jgi:hypothetical protein
MTRRRPIPLALSALIAVFSALTALALSHSHAGHAHHSGGATIGHVR